MGKYAETTTVSTGLDLASGPDVTAYTYAGLRVIITENAMQYSEDWSGCRSPARARRREKQGRRQHVKRRSVPMAFVVDKSLVIHPHLFERLKKQVGEYRPTLGPTGADLLGAFGDYKFAAGGPVRDRGKGLSISDLMPGDFVLPKRFSGGDKA